MMALKWFSLFLQATVLTAKIINYPRPSGPRFNSRIRPRVITGLTGFSNGDNETFAPAPGLPTTIDTDADIETWFLDSYQLDLSNGSSPGQIRVDRRQAPTWKPLNLNWTDSDDTHWEIQFSPCSRKGHQLLGPWTFHNGTRANVTWADIYGDIRDNMHSYSSEEEAFDAALQTNLEALNPDLATVVGGYVWDDTTGTCPSNSSLPSAPTTPSAIVTYENNTGHDELRKLLSLNLKPTLLQGLFTFASIGINAGVVGGASLRYAPEYMQAQPNFTANYTNELSSITPQVVFIASIAFLTAAVSAWLVTGAARSLRDRFTASGAIASAGQGTAQAAAAFVQTAQQAVQQTTGQAASNFHNSWEAIHQDASNNPVGMPDPIPGIDTGPSGRLLPCGPDTAVYNVFGVIQARLSEVGHWVYIYSDGDNDPRYTPNIDKWRSYYQIMNDAGLQAGNLGTCPNE